MIQIIEKRLNIPADYQYKAIRSANYIRANWHSNKYIVLNAFCKFNKKSTILELGTGSGNFELLFSKKVKSIVGVDYNDDAIRFLKTQLKNEGIKNVKLVCTDVRKIDKAIFSHKFDFIILVDVIEHISINSANKLTKNLKRVLNRKGKVCIITPNYKSPWVIIEYILDSMALAPKQSGAQHLARYNTGNLSELFSKNGFRVERIATFNLFSVLIPHLGLSNLLSVWEIGSRNIFGNMIVGIFSLKK